jgi:HEAT repeat protein
LSSPEEPGAGIGQTPESSQRGDASIVTQFFLLPLAVVAGLVGIFLLFTMATRKTPTARDYLQTMRAGRFNQRWQAAFELSNLLKKGDISAKDPALAHALVETFEQSVANPEEDPRVKRYLALALGDLRSPEAVGPLQKAAKSQDADTRLCALWGLAQLEATDSKEVFVECLADTDPAVRSVCAYGLGKSGNVGLPELSALLRDTVPEVRWNAALSLARNGDAAGERILVEMLDRKYLDSFSGLGGSEKADLIINAMRGLKHLKSKGLDATIRHLSDTDPDPVVRRAAKSWESPSPS